ncbi:DEKNAAC103580 [Brettanomyces naardenensis]|uniref:DEKNAAC103580 n=1 Tax=Brettanomyces naardenensis TaxID=13370 RepID=A0A448YN94_BRENA|nr:DEKNAAC103580 [Brettanomyces naardenensis]
MASPFFDQSLETTTEPNSVPLSQDPEPEGESQSSGYLTFKKDLTGVLGEISESSVQILYEDFQNAKDPLDKATNAYLDNPDVYQVIDDGKGRREKKRYFFTSSKRKKEDSKAAPLTVKKAKKEVSTDDNRWKREIGTIDADCWCTRSIFGSASLRKASFLPMMHADNPNVVYVNEIIPKTGHRREIGRFNEDVAKILGPLILSNSLDVRITPCYIPDNVLHIGDTFIVQVDCYLKSSLFVDDNSTDGDDFLRAYKLSNGKSGSSDGALDPFTVMKRAALLDLFGTLRLDSPSLQREKIREAVDLDQPDEQLLAKLQADSQSDSENSSSTPSSSSNITLNQLRDLYKSTQSSSLEIQLPETDPPDFKLTLRPYQKHGLSWMLQRENEYDLIEGGGTKKDEEDGSFVNPLWREYVWPKQVKGSSDSSFFINLYDGSCCSKRPVIRSTCSGGILADEMGLGKTITTLSLVFSCPMDRSIVADPRYASRTTLIVVPMALLSQWEREFIRVSDNPGRRCYIYYGSDTKDSLQFMLCNTSAPAVVLTTYGTIQSEWSKQEVTNSCKGLYSVKFFRIILDEGHIIRNRSTKTAKAIYALKASRRWILTGTPIVNRLEDLYSLIRFLGFEPWSNHSFWKHFITLPFDTGKDLALAFSLLKSILDPILLRRTKNQRDHNGNLLVELPPKEVVIERLKFNEKEEVIYNWLKARAVNTFNENFRRGLLLKNYSSILTHLLRLRQICDHIDLIKTQDQGDTEDVHALQREILNGSDEEVLTLVRNLERKEEEEKMSIEEIKEIKAEIYDLYPNFDGIECSICTGAIDIRNCVITDCKHCFCVGCLKEHFDFQESHQDEPTGDPTNPDSSLMFNAKVLCPMCRSVIKKNRLFRTIPKQFATCDDNLLTQVSDKKSIERFYMVRPFDPYGKSSKINALFSHLQQIREESPDDHVIVFSQFTSFLDIIEKELKKYGSDFKVLKFDGRLGLDQRQRVLESFEKSTGNDGVKAISVLLISLKAGGVGLNLTVASKAFLLDPHWNNAVEFQAIDRLHRVGQTKSVKVIRFIMQDSIEERMLEIQKRKNQLGEALTLNDDERRKKRIEEIQSLFKE